MKKRIIFMVSILSFSGFAADISIPERILSNEMVQQSTSFQSQYEFDSLKLAEHQGLDGRTRFLLVLRSTVRRTETTCLIAAYNWLSSSVEVVGLPGYQFQPSNCSE